MDRACWIIIAIVGALLVSMWAVFNRPDNVPVWPEALKGVSFSPFRAGQSPERPSYPSTRQIFEDLSLLSGTVKSVRTYSVAGSLAHIPYLARTAGINVTVGIWISNDHEENRREIERFKSFYSSYASNVTGIIVGNEVLLRKELTVEELAAYLDEIRQFAWGIPVSTAETWDNWLAYPALQDHVDFVAAHVLPYWEGIPVKIAHDYVIARHQELAARFPQKTIVLGEVGWPSQGRQRGGAEPSLQNQAKFLRRFLFAAERENIPYFVLEAFDQVWKTQEGTVGRYWGVYNAGRNAKFPFAEPVTPVPEWPAIAGFSLAFAILILAFVLRDSRGLLHGGRGFLVLVSYLISSIVVWLAYDYSSQYLTGEQTVVAIGLLLAACCTALVMLAEAHEWAESLWGNGRKASASDVIAGGSAGAMLAQSTGLLDASLPEPKVSVHVAIYNEPPDMVIKTLTALKNLHYTNYEVIVVDNNTASEQIWRPVESWCAEHADLFRFFHVNPLSGFKAGALNYALERTASDAELVAVIDSDYTVRPQWLSDCVRGFRDPTVSIVQAPQDYRDSDESAFKAMIYCEYAGFFGIGMVNRNARNAIIQHGTMTIVRRSTLDSVDGWGEWCITEDAELGLRVLAAGQRAVYIARSYGRGLMPDNFVDYKKQRFRWAYGSVLIMRHHMRYFLGLEKSKLSSGQRYHFVAGWLPWMADGLCLAFNYIALCYSAMMIYLPYKYAPPEVVLCLIPIGFFVFKLIKMQVLYRCRLGATWRQGVGAGLAGLAVSHTIARAMLAGLMTKDIGFFRTPKTATKHSFLKALSDAREELLFAIALILAAVLMGQRDDTYLLDTRLWITLLLIQSVPYFAAVTISLISAYTRLPAKLIQQGAEQPSLLPSPLEPIRVNES